MDKIFEMLKKDFQIGIIVILIISVGFLYRNSEEVKDEKDKECFEQKQYDRSKLEKKDSLIQVLIYKVAQRDTLKTIIK